MPWSPDDVCEGAACPYCGEEIPEGSTIDVWVGRRGNYSLLHAECGERYEAGLAAGVGAEG